MRAHPAVRLLAAAAGLIVCVALIFARLRTSEIPPPPTLLLSPDHLLADGYDTTTLSITAAATPEISITGPSGVRVEKIAREDKFWRARIRAGILPGKAEIRVATAGSKPSIAELYLTPDAHDSAEDGTPDFLRLEEEHDQQAFRRWFTFVAEAQYFQSPAQRPTEINDCAALIRYAYREALITHDGAWAATARLPLVPAFDGVAKYQYPATPLGPALFRTRPGPFRAADLTSGAFLQFSDARTLWRYNSYSLGRNLGRALPGDLLFFRQLAGREPFHSMIYLGPSQLRPDGKRYVLYHTGPEGADPGEIKRLTLEELIEFPRIEWRPVISNPAFLGVARWNILRRNVE